MVLAVGVHLGLCHGRLDLGQRRPRRGLWPPSKVYESFIPADVMADFGGEMQTVDDVLMQRDCCAVAAGISPVATGIMEKWWRQHMNDLDGGAT